MINMVFAIVTIIAVVGFSMYMASEIHDYMANDNESEKITVFE